MAAASSTSMDRTFTGVLTSVAKYDSTIYSTIEVGL